MKLKIQVFQFHFNFNIKTVTTLLQEAGGSLKKYYGSLKVLE